MAKTPPTMRSLVAPKKCSPAGYEIIQRQTPKITKPEHVLLRMRAVAINTGDTQFASGMLDILFKAEYPLPIAQEGSGVVIAVGSAVRNLKVGDAVYGLHIDKPMFRPPPPGFASDYALSEERFLYKKPEGISFEEAAALPGLSVTAYQTIRRGLELQGRDSLAGQTVYIPAALSASGSIAIQVARNYYGADKIISTVSTPKMPFVEENLPGMVNQLYDYKTQDVPSLVGKGTVDFVYNTQFSTFDESAAVLKPQSGILMSIASIPTSAVMRPMVGPDRTPFWLCWLLDFAQIWYKWKLRGTKIKHEFVSGGPHIREDTEVVADLIAKGKIRAVYTTVDLGDLDEVRKACGRVATGKGGFGKLVLRISGEKDD
ncbi:zinc-binding dehydrogenase [Fusarium albosuccineum]|uniref:Zinc-binding dehydrogenase n=1 Tax=Fusarium albosuccineum TaxID=1237068 RepID=A0A8H4PD41_9HYPO|nr:zinc-binding dehydrogenase [Fusarium albosuccineum]